MIKAAVAGSFDVTLPIPITRGLKACDTQVQEDDDECVTLPIPITRGLKACDTQVQEDDDECVTLPIPITRGLKVKFYASVRIQLRRSYTANPDYKGTESIRMVSAIKKKEGVTLPIPITRGLKAPI